jgi:hypothetical protein
MRASKNEIYLQEIYQSSNQEMFAISLSSCTHYNANFKLDQYIYIHIYIHHIYICIYTYYIYIYIYILYIHIHTHIHIYIYIHTYIHSTICRHACFGVLCLVSAAWYMSRYMTPPHLYT